MSPQEFHTPIPATELAIPSLLTSPEALETYLADVKRRRDDFREQRRRAYWQSAIERLTEELQAAEQDQDTEIISELRTVLCAFTDALAAVSNDAAGLPDVDTADVDTAEVDGTPQGNLPDISPAAPISKNGISGAFSPIEADSNGIHTGQNGAAVSNDVILDHMEQQLLEQEARATLAVKAEDLENRICAHLAAGDNTLSAAIRTRALLCEGQALIYDPHTSKQRRQPLLTLLDDLAAGTPWAGSHPLGGAMLSPQAWTQLAELYNTCIVAADTMDWYEDNEEYLGEAARIDLLNAIAASQQRLYRRSESLLRRDDVLHELYRRAKAAALKTAYIRALSPHTDDKELAELAAHCAEIWHGLQNEVEQSRTQAEKQTRKEAAICAVVDWNEALEGRSITSETQDADRVELCRLLDECLAASVPTTNVKVRSAILDTAPVLLAGEAKYAKFMEAVQAERARRSLDAVKVEAPQPEVKDEDLDLLVGSVIEFTRGKKIVMLGGKSRPQVAQELRTLLECDVSWPDSDNGDKFRKFAAVIKKADVVLLLKNFASHELFYASKEEMAVEGKHFVVLPSGYGIKQVLFQLQEHVARQKVAA